MKLYFSPMSCSLAARIALYEAGADAAFEEVDRISKRTASGRDYREVHPLGLVPALELDTGELLVENAAVLQSIARRYPAARLAPTDERGTARLQQHLCFVGTELHKGIFNPLFERASPPEVKSWALGKVDSRFAWLAAQLEGRSFLLEDFSVADAYLVTVLNWTQATPVDLSRWPALQDYLTRQRERPGVARAIRDEFGLYKKEVARHPVEAA